MAINLYYKTMQEISTSYIYGQDILPKYIVMIYRKEYLTFSTKKNTTTRPMKTEPWEKRIFKYNLIFV